MVVKKIHGWVYFYSELIMIFSLTTDEELALDSSLDRDDCHKLYWEREFKPVAEKLLDRIQSHHSSLPTVTITPF